MKVSAIFLFLLVSSFGFTQDNHIVKTEDGRRVLLKADFTWEYIDLEKPADSKISTLEAHTKNGCNLPLGFEEPKLNAKIQAQLKKGRATMAHVKQKVAKDYGCDVNDVVLLSVSEKKSTANYTLCANGKKVFYKRTGLKILEKGKLF
ncbi:MAG: DUF3157 family protein [Jejuia sp.]